MQQCLQLIGLFSISVYLNEIGEDMVTLQPEILKQILILLVFSKHDLYIIAIEIKNFSFALTLFRQQFFLFFAFKHI